ncbi:hypothetical protein H7J77_01735 [Mycolicibacillus parakoreensis]|uniref:DUF6474 family protein n=1 Tax=Mycolicibacillus parakoreensis TaxID=1069221 RepID=A0ABY3U5F4_9MYCO|nr:DUF6474 family protein [Mycolicibacillus parakoreensis]MCV7314272.1 hypothetical protein [Mycolicibacillus parakoreensis]ULN52981.1 DUF6474 family protein [Mycolicibacillus parakoreensis]HLR98186.1 DUF6474 family protein [Mycolicibacillus parakoreensis]
MGLFRKRKTRAERRAEARAVKARAKLEAKLAAKNEARRFKSTQRADAKALKAQLKAQRDSDRAVQKAAETELKAAQEGRVFSPTRIKRLLTVSRLLAPVVIPVLYRAATAARGWLDERRADQLGIPLAQVGQYAGHGAQLSARIAGAEKTLRAVQDNRPKDPETKQFTTAMTARLADLAAAVTAAQNMPAQRRRTAHAAIAAELDGIDADLLARLGLD